MRGTRRGAGQRGLEPRLAAVLCYLLGMAGGVILLMVERESRFVRFHALQSILYSGVVILVLLVLTVAGLAMLSAVVAGVAAVVWLYLIYRAALGRWYQLPGLGWLAERNV